MPSIKEAFYDGLCGLAVGVAKGLFGIGLYTANEVEEINHLKNLAESVVKKAPKIVGEPVICEAIRKGQKVALSAFEKTATPEQIAAGVVTAANVVCTKAFKERFAEVLMDSCLNLVGCGY